MNSALLRRRLHGQQAGRGFQAPGAWGGAATFVSLDLRRLSSKGFTRLNCHLRFVAVGAPRDGKAWGE